MQTHFVKRARSHFNFAYFFPIISATFHAMGANHSERWIKKPNCMGQVMVCGKYGNVSTSEARMGK